MTSRRKTNRRPEPGGDRNDPPTSTIGASQHDHSLAREVLDELEEIPGELAEKIEDVREEIEDSAIARWAVRTYVGIMSRAPQSARGKALAIVAVFLVFLMPSMALLYYSITADQDAAESWFGNLGYPGVFLANLAGTGTLFIPVPGVTAAAQALIVSSSNTLSPFWVGVLGGLGMAIGEITAYVAGMAASVIAKEENIKAPSLLRPLVAKVTGWVTGLMNRYGMPTLFTLSVVPNPLFELAGWSAGAMRYPFWKYMGSVAPGCVLRGLLLAYFGASVFDWALHVF